MERAGLQLVSELPETPPTVIADGRLLSRVLDNLMSNAVKYSMRGTRVYLSLQAYSGTAAITLRNISGAPLNVSPEELTERIVRTVEELVFLREHGYTGSIVTDHSVYCWNSSSAKVIGRYADGSVVPLELAGPECAQLYEKISGEAILTVYGRAPMMISAGCVRKTSGQCKGSGDAFLQIRDRMGETFPVRCVCGRDRDLCHNVIFNSVPLSLHAALSDSAVRAADGLLVCFMDEAPALAGEIAAYYRNGMPGRDGSAEPGANRKPFPVEKYTTGHYRKGAL